MSSCAYTPQKHTQSHQSQGPDHLPLALVLCFYLVHNDKREWIQRWKPRGGRPAFTYSIFIFHLCPSGWVEKNGPGTKPLSYFNAFFSNPSSLQGYLWSRTAARMNTLSIINTHGGYVTVVASICCLSSHVRPNWDNEKDVPSCLGSFTNAFSQKTKNKKKTDIQTIFPNIINNLTYHTWYLKQIILYWTAKKLLKNIWWFTGVLRRIGGFGIMVEMSWDQ